MVVKIEEPPPLPKSDQTSLGLFTLLARDVADPGQRMFWCGTLICIGLFTRLFWSNLDHFYYAWTTDENYSHGFLVPLISLYFAGQVARRTGTHPRRAVDGHSAFGRRPAGAPGDDTAANPVLG